MKDKWRISNENRKIWNITLFQVKYKGKYPSNIGLSNAYYYTIMHKIWKLNSKYLINSSH
jgi:hypothetical protein